MKSKLLLYLFVFTAVILVFQLVNSAKVVNFQAETLEMKNDRIEELKNELQAAREPMQMMFIFLWIKI